jgi:hypothetical protein
MEEMPMSDSTDVEKAQLRLKSLAEFRFQMRKFLNFSEMASERCGIPAQQYQLMQVIAAMPGDEQASITYLAERMILRHNSTVELVDRAACGPGPQGQRPDGLAAVAGAVDSARA